jgi:superfamily II DNA/RNA helicase
MEKYAIVSGMTENTEKPMTFSQLGITERLVETLASLSITEPTAVQGKVIPLVAAGKNIMFQSETGTGKTFAYLLPLVQKVEQEIACRTAEGQYTAPVKILIAAPTYELASQIKVQVQLVTKMKCALCIGGSPIARQIELLKEKPVIVIGGPSRLLELIHLKKLKADDVEVLVLDEADRLLSPELRDETEGLLDRLPKSVQLIGCSATVSDYTRKTLQNARDNAPGAANGTSSGSKNAGDTAAGPIELVTLPPEDVLRKKITHWALFAERRDKIDTLRSFINAVKPQKLIVFTSRSDQIDNIVGKLKFKKIDCAGLSSKTDKTERKSAIDRFRSGKCPVLITTDLASRGLDIAGITHVVQMDLPESTDFFIHRAGRTARAGQTGFNCVIGDEVEMEQYAALEKKLHITVYPMVLYGGRLVPPDTIKEY